MVERPEPLNAMPHGNVPVYRLERQPLSVEGYSRAAVQTYWQVPEWKILLDHGNHPWEFARCPQLALTHPHIDHSAGLVSYISTRALLNMEPPKVFVPAEYRAAWERQLEATRALTRDPLPCEFVSCEADRGYAIGQDRLLRPFSARHVIPTLGYMLCEVRRKLKPELAALSSDEIRTRRQGGEEVTIDTETPLLAYCGDTGIGVLEDYPELYRVPVLLLECTFLPGPVSADQARSLGHVHWDQLEKRAHLFQNETLVLTHFSSRWSTETIVEAARALDERMQPTVVPWV